MGNLNIVNHPLISTKLAKLRDKNTGNKEFRELVEELAALLFYEATRDMPEIDATIETPICTTTCKVVDTKFAIVPILRAGIGMVNGIVNLMPTMKVGHIGIYREPESLMPVEYYCKLPYDCDKRITFLIDPMLATGGTASSALTYLKQHGVTKIKFISLLCAPEGVKRLQEDHPDIDIYTASLDEKLNDHGYIVPGLGDAGDRLFGTK